MNKFKEKRDQINHSPKRNLYAGRCFPMIEQALEADKTIPPPQGAIDKIIEQRQLEEKNNPAILSRLLAGEDAITPNVRIAGEEEIIAFTDNISPCKINEIWDNLYSQVTAMEGKYPSLIIDREPVASPSL